MHTFFFVLLSVLSNEHFVTHFKLNFVLCINQNWRCQKNFGNMFLKEVVYFLKFVTYLLLSRPFGWITVIDSQRFPISNWFLCMAWLEVIYAWWNWFTHTFPRNQLTENQSSTQVLRIDDISRASQQKKKPDFVTRPFV